MSETQMFTSLHRHIWRRVRAAYYAFGLARFPFGDALGRAVSNWEIAQGLGDSPKAKSKWDAEYSGGLWDYMHREIARNWVLIGYMDAFRSGGEYLEIGCGDGVLFEHFKRLGYTRYIGVDISDVAIEKLRIYNNNCTNFSQGDGDVYEPVGLFDVIVFNESLFYLRDPVRSLKRYAEALKPGGLFIVSNYTASRRSLAVLRDAKQMFEILNEAKTTEGSISWLCTVLKRRSNLTLP
jgi:SAM-dependent methyltransferase